MYRKVSQHCIGIILQWKKKKTFTETYEWDRHHLTAFFRRMKMTRSQEFHWRASPNSHSTFWFQLRRKVAAEDCLYSINSGPASALPHGEVSLFNNICLTSLFTYTLTLMVSYFFITILCVNVTILLWVQCNFFSYWIKIELENKKINRL